MNKLSKYKYLFTLSFLWYYWNSLERDKEKMRASLHFLVTCQSSVVKSVSKSAILLVWVCCVCEHTYILKSNTDKCQESSLVMNFTLKLVMDHWTVTILYRVKISFYSIIYWSFVSQNTNGSTCSYSFVHRWIQVLHNF